MADSRVTITGPIDKDSSSLGPETDLYLADETRAEAETNTNPMDIPGQDDNEALLAALTGKRDFRYSGVANGMRLQNAGFGSDPVEALRNYLFELEGLVLPYQGIGYILDDREQQLTPDPTVEDSRGVLFDNVTWTYETGQSTRAEYTIAGKVTEGVQEPEEGQEDRNAYIADQQSRQTNVGVDMIGISDLGSYVLGDVQERRYERDIDLDVMELVHAFDIPNIGVIKSGVKGQIMLSGVLTENDVNENLRQLSSDFTTTFHGENARFLDAFTQRVFEGAVEESSTLYEQGTPNRMEYEIKIRIGAEIT